LKKIQGLFKDLHRNLRIFQGKMEFKDFSRTSPKIQGFFKTVQYKKTANTKERKDGQTWSRLKQIVSTIYTGFSRIIISLE